MTADFDRLWSKVDRNAGPDACWPWTGACSAKGYGLIRICGRTARAHRVAWIAVHGAIPDGMCVCHRCDNPPCCNPEHLWLGTNADNTRDKLTKGRTPSGESHALARLTDAQVLDVLAAAATGENAVSIARRFDVSRGCVVKIKLGYRRVVLHRALTTESIVPVRDGRELRRGE